MHGNDRSGSRRGFLAGVGTSLGVGTAGCTGLLGDDGTWDAGGPPARSDWEVTLADRFEAGELDRSLWQNGFGELPLLCPYHGGRAHCAVPEQSYLADGRLVLEAAHEPPTVPEDERWQEGTDPEYSVGAVHTEGQFEQEFGYFEARTRVESGPGTNPAFWLFTIDDTVHREINVEFRPDDGGRLVDVGVVYEGSGGDLRHRTYRHTLDTPAADRFRTWGIEWGPDAIAIDLEGERVWTDEHFADDLTGVPMWIVFDFGVFDGAEWIGHPEPETFPRRFEVEWVRAWQHEDWA